MKYYQRDLAGYAKWAGHLTMLEHGAYTLLLDRYYTTEQPIPEGDVYRLARARTRAERDAVDAVLTEFFENAEGLWSHARAEEEIEKTSAAGDRSRKNGKNGGRPKKAEADKPPPCPHAEIIAAYHEILPELPPVNDWPDASATNLKNQWRKSKDRQSVEWWRELFGYVRKSAFLMGSKTDFQASLGWIVKPANFAKVVNGNYDNRGRT